MSKVRHPEKQKNQIHESEKNSNHDNKKNIDDKTKPKTNTSIIERFTEKLKTFLESAE